jgi:hypothetical protein
MTEPLGAKEMMSLRHTCYAFVAVLVLAPVMALAAPLPDGETLATLAHPLPNALNVIVDGRRWECAGQACVAYPTSSMESQGLSRECRRAAQDLGAFTAYQTGVRVMTMDELAACNLKATKPR